MTLRERQLAYVMRNVSRAEEAGHRVTMQSRQGSRGAQYTAVCSCGWEAPRWKTMPWALSQVMAHVGSVVPLSLGDLEDARRVGLNVP